MEDMTRLELLTLLLSIKALLESDNIDKAKELINEVINEAKQKEKGLTNISQPETITNGRYLPPPALFILT